MPTAYQTLRKRPNVHLYPTESRVEEVTAHANAKSLRHRTRFATLNANFADIWPSYYIVFQSSAVSGSAVICDR